MEVTTPVGSDKSRGARLEARISVEQKTVLQQAAALSGRTLSEFVVASAQEAASRVIQEHETVRLSRTEQIAFVSALLKPPLPSALLREKGVRSSFVASAACQRPHSKTLTPCPHSFTPDSLTGVELAAVFPA